DRNNARALCGNALGDFCEKRRHEQLSELRGGRNIDLVDARLAMDTHTNRHATLGDGEQRLVCSGKRAARESDAKRASAFVCANRGRFNSIEVKASLGCSTGDLEDHEVTSDTATLVLL